MRCTIDIRKMSSPSLIQNMTAQTPMYYSKHFKSFLFLIQVKYLRDERHNRLKHESVIDRNSFLPGSIDPRYQQQMSEGGIDGSF